MSFGNFYEHDFDNSPSNFIENFHDIWKDAISTFIENWHIIPLMILSGIPLKIDTRIPSRISLWITSGIFVAILLILYNSSSIICHSVVTYRSHKITLNPAYSNIGKTNGIHAEHPEKKFNFHKTAKINPSRPSITARMHRNKKPWPQCPITLINSIVNHTNQINPCFGFILES